MKLKNLFPFLLILILFHIFLILILSFNTSEVEFYGFDWHYSSTPAGIVHSYFTDNEELIFNREYLFEVSVQNSYSIIEIVLSIILLLSSIISMIFLYKNKTLIKYMKGGI